MLARNTEYAIRALVYIRLSNWKKKRPGVSEIAREIEAPEAYLAKILQVLTRHRIINSRKGRGGGFHFTDDGNTPTLHDVILVMEGDACFKKCAFGFMNCNDANPCPLHEHSVLMRESLHSLTRSETIGSITQKIIDGKAFLKSTLEDRHSFSASTADR
jgi:Rrf2 family protein